MKILTKKRTYAKIKKMKKVRTKYFRQSKRLKLKDKIKIIPLDKRIEEAITLSELCQDLKRELENAKILPKNN